MATNRWLEGLKTLDIQRESLFSTLKAKDINVFNNDTLSNLLSKVNLLKSPLEKDEEETYTLDPLWRFPDPLGTDTMKNIREIYDEDPMASTYNYRGIYMIYGDFDSIDLKAMLENRTNADTFITSDGITYTDITDTSLIHSWNKEYDIIDSKNRVIRYIKIYTNTSYSYLPGFNGKLAWAVHKLYTSLSSTSRSRPSNGSITSSNYTSYVPNDKVLNRIWNCDDFQILELDDCTLSQTGSASYLYGNTLGDPLYIKLFNIQSWKLDQATYALANLDKRLKWLDIGFKENVSCTLNVYQGAHLIEKARYLNINVPDSSTLTTIYLSVPNLKNYEEFLNNLSLNEKLTSLYLYNYQHMTINIPKGLTKIYLNKARIKELDLSSYDNLSNVTIDSCAHLEKLILPSNLTSFTYSSIVGIRELILPLNWSLPLNLICFNLKYDNILDILNKLVDLTGSSTKTLTLGPGNLAKLTDEEKAIATNKNWTLA